MNTPARAISAIRNLPPFPPVAAKVIALLADDFVSLRMVADLLKTDAALSAEVLRLANSPLFSARSEINNVQQALAFLGIGRLTGLMLTISLSKILKRAKSNQMIRRSWRHNLAAALAAQEFSSSFGANANEAYNSGLFHDVGRLAFVAADPALYETLLRKGGDVRQLEREVFGADHCEAGAWLMSEWKLPRVFVEAARNHHNPAPESGELLMLVNAACMMANRLGFSVGVPNAAEVELAGDDHLGESIAERIAILEREFGL